MPQEIGRVLLNLYNNAFYAVWERPKRQGQDSYHPQVRVSTKRQGQQLMVGIRDNGVDIPEAIKAKIFQPFLPPSPSEMEQVWDSVSVTISLPKGTAYALGGK